MGENISDFFESVLSRRANQGQEKIYLVTKSRISERQDTIPR